MKIFKKLKAKYIICTATLACLLSSAASANNLTESTLGQGVQNMINDATTGLLILCPLVGGLCAVGFLICRGMADEDTDAKRWNKRIKVAICCAVGGALVSGVIKLVASYFV